MSTVVYVVGGPDSPKKNKWELLTNSKVEAEKARDAIEGGVMRDIRVQPPKPKNGH